MRIIERAWTKERVTDERARRFSEIARDRERERNKEYIALAFAGVGIVLQIIGELIT